MDQERELKLQVTSLEKKYQDHWVKLYITLLYSLVKDFDWKRGGGGGGKQKDSYPLILFFTSSFHNAYTYVYSTNRLSMFKASALICSFLRWMAV